MTFSLDESGSALIERAEEARQLAHRQAKIAAGVREARRQFKAENCLPEGMTSDQWYELMRGPAPEV